MIDATPAVPPINITSNSAQDVEPSISTITASGVDRTFTTFIEYNPNPAVRYSSTTSFSSPFNNNAVPSTGYSYSGDPANAENFSTGGQGALRTYCAGIAFNGDETAPNAIVVWHSDPSDNGSFTASPTIVDSRYPTAPAAYFLDKPSIAVSWHNSTDLGYVYVAYVSYDYPYTGHAGNTAIVLATSTNGGSTFTVHSPIAYGGSDGSGSEVFNPQVVVSSATGTVWVMWLDHANNQIRAASSTDYGSTFGSHEIAANTNIYLGTVTGNIRANTVPNARYNAAVGNIDLTWHDNVSGTQNVQYAYRDGTGWHRPSSSIVQYTGHNAFMPALDYNTSGNVVITYYYQPSGTAAYRAYEAYISSSGTRIDSTDHDMSGFDSTPGGNDFIGDYQTVWDWTFSSGEKATAAWIGVSSGQYDTYLSRISY
ncbi:MAG: hypothetical protein DMF56_18780 [Acidobacteria bacterium]|nr:MAG: hypothetical protein DMF56_18780 [Acidobacteriota bacterium]